LGEEEKVEQVREEEEEVDFLPQWLLQHPLEEVAL
jgi:hypothetical protein